MTSPSITVNRALAAVKPYKVSISGQLPFHEKLKYLKLDWNEATIPPSPKVLQALQEIMATGALNFYPDVTATELRSKLSAYVGLDAEHIQVSNGSDEGLRLICDTFLNTGDVVLFRDPTYTQIEPFITGRGAGIMRFVGDTATSPNPERYREYLAKHRIGMVYIANPNNPTGVLYEEGFIRELCASHPTTLFVIDEAYGEFAQYTVCHLVREFRNLIVTRTFSKAFCMAGLRIGYMLADPVLLRHMDLLRNGKDVNLLAQIAAAAALDDVPYMQSYVKEVITTRDWLFGQLRASGVEACNTRANFLLVRVPEVGRIEEELRKQKILVRDRSSLPQLADSFRVSIGTRKQMAQFLSAFLDVLAGARKEKTS
jgi:histidinol-phosphate aminotransferase